MVSCKEVMVRHSEYRDGMLSDVESELIRGHLAKCPKCGHYDRALNKGVELLRQRLSLEPDSAFVQSLRTRIILEDERAAMRPVTIAASASVSIAAVLAFVAWLPALVGVHSNAVPGNITQAALPVPVRASEIAWHVATAVQDAPAHDRLDEPDVSLTSNNADVSFMDRGYTPLIVESPVAPPSYLNASFTTYDNR